MPADPHHTHTWTRVDLHTIACPCGAEVWWPLHAASDDPATIAPSETGTGASDAPNSAHANEREAAIRTRLDAATPGPWEPDDEGCCVYARHPDNECIAQMANGHYITPAANVAFVAHAPADVAWLLAELARVRAAGNALADAVERAGVNGYVRRALAAWKDAQPDNPQGADT